MISSQPKFLFSLECIHTLIRLPNISKIRNDKKTSIQCQQDINKSQTDKYANIFAFEYIFKKTSLSIFKRTCIHICVCIVAVCVHVFDLSNASKQCHSNQFINAVYNVTIYRMVIIVVDTLQSN